MFYFDNSATTQPLEEIIKVIEQVNRNYFANPSSAHRLGEQASALLNSARQQIANILGYNLSEIYFASSGTEVNNWVMQSILNAIKEHHPRRNKILISAIEHPATIEQIPLLQTNGYDVEVIPVTTEGIVDLNYFSNQLDDSILLVSTMAVNNEVGSIQPITEIASLLNDFPQIIWHVDGVQAITTQLKLLQEKRIDLLTLSSHKFHAGRGAGILAKRERVASQPLLHGGGQERNMRSSTENLSAIVAASKALRLADDNQASTKNKLALFRASIEQFLKKLAWQTFADNTASEHVICAALPPVPGEVLLHALEELDIYVSTTSACASRKHTPHATLRAMNVADDISKSAIRISMSSQTTQAEVTYLLQGLEQITEKFRIKK